MAFRTDFFQPVPGIFVSAASVVDVQRTASPQPTESDPYLYYIQLETGKQYRILFSQQSAEVQTFLTNLYAD